MDLLGKKPEKRFGQNFITDINLLKAIVADADIKACDNVLEIGAGAGTLTKVLAQSAQKVTAYEIDLSLKPLLEKTLADINNAEIIFKDFLKEDEFDVLAYTSQKYKVVANLPYYITSPVIFKILDFAIPPESLTIMVQYEVGLRLTAREKTPEYGALTVGVGSMWNAKITRKVKKEMFLPRPKVDSCIVHLTYMPHIVKDRNFLRRVVKSAFHMRRKQLVNNLIADFDLPKTKITDILVSMGLDANIRGEDLSIDSFVSLSDILYKNTNGKE